MIHVFCCLRLLLDNHKITDQAMKSISKTCSELRHVCLIDCPNISDVSLKAFMFSPLTVLNLTDCVRYELSSHVMYYCSAVHLFDNKEKEERFMSEQHE